MSGLKETLARLARLQQKNARELAEKLQDAATQPLAQGRLVSFNDFGSNPGNLRMFAHVPAKLEASPPLVVALHGCTQNAATYDYGSGWSQLAEREGFAVLYPQQIQDNNPNACFNWFHPEDTGREGGEAQSIHQMVRHMVARFGIDTSRIYVVGLSAGGAMTSVMLASYPETFAGGAIIAGLPYGAATSLRGALDSMANGSARSSSAWGDLVREGAPARKSWPKLSVWHGNADTVVNRKNGENILQQWTDLHGLAVEPAEDETVVGYRRRVWRDASGEDVIEAYTISGLGHGVPIAITNVSEAVGRISPYHFDVGISSTLEIARFWGLAKPSKPNWRERLVCATTPSTQGEAGAAPNPLPLAAFDTMRARLKANPRPANQSGLPLGSAMADPLAAITQSLKNAGVIAAAKEAKPDRRDARALITATLRSVGLLKE